MKIEMGRQASLVTESTAPELRGRGLLMQIDAAPNEAGTSASLRPPVWRHMFASRRRSLWYQNITATLGPKNVKECFVKGNPILPLLWNETANRFEVLREAEAVVEPGVDRHRRRRHLLPSILEEQESSLIHESSRRLKGNIGDVIVYGRSCHCASEFSASTSAASNPYYCPDSAPVCTVFYDRSNRPSLTVTCANGSNTPYARYFFPLSFFLVFFYAFLCACSPKGLAARLHVKNKRLGCLLRRRQGIREADEAPRPYDEQALVEGDLDWLLQRQQARHRLAVESARHEGPHQRLFIPGSSPVSALLLELSARQQTRRQHQEPPQEQRPPPTTTTARSSDPPLVELPTIPTGVVASLVDGDPSSQLQFSSAQASRSPAVFLLRTRVYDGPAPRTTDDAADFERNDGDEKPEEEWDGETDGCVCSICLIDLEPGDRVAGIPCRHAFHSRCIKDWIQRRHGHCPLCKAEIPLLPTKRKSRRRRRSSSNRVRATSVTSSTPTA